MVNNNGVGTIFIFGIMPRSGTNFLHKLICRHPDVVDDCIVSEDYLVHNSDLISEYIEKTFDRWPLRWEVKNKLGDEDFMYRCIGQGLKSFLCKQVPSDYNSDGSAVLVTKTPSVRNLGLFFRLFPDSKAIILVRDGRNTAESFMNTFGANYEACFRRWQEGAKEIRRIKDSEMEDGKFILVRYEDLYLNMRETVGDILDFAGLDGGKYDFDDAESLGVVGSSTFKDKYKDGFKWKDEGRPEGFNPLERWKGWSGVLKRRFYRVAREDMEYFGYVMEWPGGSIFSFAVDCCYDFLQFLKRCWRGLVLRRFLWKIADGLKGKNGKSVS